MHTISPKLVVGVFGGMRIAIGTACALAPGRFAGPEPSRPRTLMPRSFAVREIVLGLGGLLAFTRADSSPGTIRTWARLGALTDAGDLAAALAAGRAAEPAAGLSALIVATGLALEGWASIRHPG